METGSAAAGIFFGRTKICSLLEKRFDAFLKGYRQNVALIGPPFVGKSSAAQSFLKRLPRSEVVVVSVSCQEHDSFERFVQRWISELLYGFYDAFQKPLPPTLQDLIRALKGIIPKTLERMKLIKRLIMRHRFDQAFDELLSLSGLLHLECGRKVLMVLDECDRLDQMGLSDPFAHLGRAIMIEKDTMFLVTSSHPTPCVSIFREKLSLLFGNFEVIQVGPLDFDESRELIKQNIPDREIGEMAIRFLIRLTDGHPYYLSLLMDELRRPLSCDLNLNDDLMIQVLTQELFNDRGSLSQHFQAQLYYMAQGRPWTLLGDVLLSISMGHKKHSQIVQFLRMKGNEAKKILERLLSCECVEKHGSLFRIPDSMFRFWLSQVYYRKRFLSSGDSEAGQAGFQRALRRVVEEHAFEEQRELPKRIERLFLKFRNDIVVLNQRPFKCPHFTEVHSRPNNGRVFPVFARNDRTRWLCQVSSESVREEDVQTFLQDSTRFRGPIQKKLMIGLRGIDLNAKLLAHEAKIQYLDLRSLNFLMDLYDQPKIIP